MVENQQAVPSKVGTKSPSLMWVKPKFRESNRIISWQFNCTVSILSFSTLRQRSGNKAFWALQLGKFMASELRLVSYYAPTLKMLGCIFLLACVCVCVCVTHYYASCNFWTVHAMVLKLHIRISHGIIADLYLCIVRVMPLVGVMLYWKKWDGNLVSTISQNVFELGPWYLVYWLAMRGRLPE